jgi:hypothetical protein
MTQTAVEWLVNELETHHVFHDIKNTVAYQQAKEMEEKQKRDSYDKGHYDASTYYCNMDEE